MRRQLRFLFTIDFYYARQTLVLLVLCFLALLGIATMANLFERAEDFQIYAEKQQLSLSQLLLLMGIFYLNFSTSLVMQHILPLLIALTTSMVVTRAVMKNEYTILRAGGVSVRRSIIPVLFPIVVLVFSWQQTRDLLLPQLLRTAVRMQAEVRGNTVMHSQSLVITDGLQRHQIDIGHHDPRGSLYNFRLMVSDSRTGAMLVPQRVYSAPQVELISIANDRGYDFAWNPVPDSNNSQNLGTILRCDVSPFQTEFWTEPVPTPITPGILERQMENLGDNILTSADLRALRSRDNDAAIQYQLRLAEPFLLIATSLLTMGLCLRRALLGDSAGQIRNSVTAVFVAMTTMSLQIVAVVLGDQHIISPYAAAWAPVVLLLSYGLFLVLRLEK